jgi:hypothetical protein
LHLCQDASPGCFAGAEETEQQVPFSLLNFVTGASALFEGKFNSEARNPARQAVAWHWFGFRISDFGFPAEGRPAELQQHGRDIVHIARAQSIAALPVPLPATIIRMMKIARFTMFVFCFNPRPTRRSSATL